MPSDASIMSFYSEGDRQFSAKILRLSTQLTCNSTVIIHGKYIVSSSTIIANRLINSHNSKSVSI